MGAFGLAALLLTALRTGARAPVPGPAECPVTDLTPAFWSFWEAAKDKAGSEQR